MKLLESKFNKPGIYLLKNLVNNKIYIGSTKNVEKRMKHYVWGSLSKSSYNETKRVIVCDIRKYGTDNFDLMILESGDHLYDTNTRLSREQYFIRKYDATNPSVGYNLTDVCFSGGIYSRKQSKQERYNRSKFLVVVDIQMNTIFPVTSAKVFSEIIKCSDRSIITRGIKRGSLIYGRYFIYYMDDNLRESLMLKLQHKKVDADFQVVDKHGREGRRRSTESFLQYKKYYDLVSMNINDIKQYLLLDKI